GRARMRADTSLRPDLPPRALPIATGERLPSGHSTAARMFPVPVPPGAIDRARLSEAQQQRQLLPQAMAAYIQWLAGRIDALRDALPARFRALREKAQTVGRHAREPAQVAHLYLGLETFLTFAVEVGVLNRDRADEVLEAAWEALTAVAAEHGRQLAAET